MPHETRQGGCHHRLRLAHYILPASSRASVDIPLIFRGPWCGDELTQVSRPHSAYGVRRWGSKESVVLFFCRDNALARRYLLHRYFLFCVIGFKKVDERIIAVLFKLRCTRRPFQLIKNLSALIFIPRCRQRDSLEGFYLYACPYDTMGQASWLSESSVLRMRLFQLIVQKKGWKQDLWGE